MSGSGLAEALGRVAVVGALILCAGCRPPAADAAIAEQLTQMSDAIIGMRDQVAVLSTTVDSLVQVTAKQDTIIRRLMAANGIPTP